MTGRVRSQVLPALVRRDWVVSLGMCLGIGGIIYHRG